MSLAFGWFLLILFGTIEADIFGAKHLNAPYKAIFFRFFNPEHGRMGFEAAYGFFMDLILAFILSGLLLAVLKRFYSKVVGMKKTTRLKLTDKIALTSLWLIFPSRLLAESFTSGAYGTGSFLTGTLGPWLASFLACSADGLSILVALFTLSGYIFYSSSDYPIYAYSNRTVSDFHEELRDKNRG